MALVTNLLQRAYHSVDTLAEAFLFIREDIKGARKYDVPLRTRIRAWRNGFHSGTWTWLRLNEKNPKDFLNNIHAALVIPTINDHYSDVLADTIAFTYASAPYKELLPTIYGTIHDGTFQPYHEGQPDTIWSILNDYSEIILKPICGSQGTGIHKITATETSGKDAIRVDGESASRNTVREFISVLDGYVVTEYITQHPYADDIFPGAVNTIRIMTVTEPPGKATIVSASHRFGTAQSAPTDNWSRGGMCAPIDIKTGELSEVVYEENQERIVEASTHPETGAEIAGVRIPQWDELTAAVMALADHHWRARYVGWDVVLTETGPVIIEGNANPGIHVPQVESGLLENEAVKDLFDSIQF